MSSIIRILKGLVASDDKTTQPENAAAASVAPSSPAPKAKPNHAKAVGFEALGLTERICRAVAEEGYENPTPIQAASIPEVIKGRDLLGCAQTGTGKTAAFALPILHRLATETAAQNNAPRALILTPTRELALQIAENFTGYGRHLRLRSAVVFGGVGIVPQKQTLSRGVDILVATPGRLLDLMSQRAVNLRSLEIFVLDEADRMLDMGFIHDVRKVIAALPKQRQNLMFSATMPGPIQELAMSVLKDPAKVEVARVSSTNEQIDQRLYYVDKGDKKSLLLHILKTEKVTRALIFTRTKSGANRLSEALCKAGIQAEAIHGNKSQTARQRALDGFKKGTTPVLVASDLASRGIDVDEISHVINFEVPNVAETYVHRIGRTGRAMASGLALSLCDAEERAYIRGIERLTGKAIPVVRDHPYHSDEAEASQHKGGPQQRRGQHGQQRSRQGQRQGQQRQGQRQGQGQGQRSQGGQASEGQSRRRNQGGRSRRPNAPRPE